MRSLRLLGVLLPLAFAPGLAAADGVTPVHGYEYRGGYGYAPRPWYPPPHHRRWGPPPPRGYYGPPPVRWAPPPPPPHRGPRWGWDRRW